MRAFAPLSALLLFLVAGGSFAAEPVAPTISSPNGDIELEFSLSEAGAPLYSVRYRQKSLIEASPLGLTLEQAAFDSGFTLANTSTSSHDSSWTPFAGERAVIEDKYNSLLIELKNQRSQRLSIEFRVYNEGVAFCYEVPEQKGLKELEILDEGTRFRFTMDSMCWSSAEVEGEYDHVRISRLQGRRERPLVVEVEEGPVAAVGEARMVDYARMQLAADPESEHTLMPVLDGKVKAATPFKTPWRYLMIADSPGGLVEGNDLVRNLNDPCAIEDTSWIRPGKVFRSILSTEGAKASVDLAVEMDMQYILLDAGWYGNEFKGDSDATTVTVDPKRYDGPLDMPAVISYAKERGIGVFLYVNRRALEKQLDEILPLFQEWGVAGIKFGFVRVGPQEWTRWVHEAVKKCADHKIMVNIHDHYLPTGWSRTYPNLLTQEGIHGNEQMPTPEHNVTLPFIRFLCGPADYTVCYYSGRIQTTRAHQLAASIVYFSPLQVLFWYDKASQYRGEPELDIFRQLVTTWDDTRVVHGKIGQYATIARQSGPRWFVGSMNAQEQRRIEIPLDFLVDGVTYEAAIYSDQDPSGGEPRKVLSTRKRVTSESVLQADMAANGGQAMILTPVAD